MPRPKNVILRDFFHVNNLNEIVCKNGRCGGKILSSHAGNLERHLKALHFDLYATYLQRKKTTHFPGVRSIVKITKEINKNNMGKAIIELFTRNGRPLNMAEDRAFKMLVQPVFDALHIQLNEHNILERIITYSTDMKEGIIEELDGRLLSLKVDVATRPRLSVLRVNVQYIKNKCVAIKTLAMRELKARHTGPYLKSVILEVLGDYQIDINQILTVTTDDEVNLVKAVRYLNEELKNSVEGAHMDDSTEDSLASIETNFSSDFIINIRSGILTLQQCVDDVLKSEDIERRVAHCRSVAGKLRSQTYHRHLRYGGYERPALDCETNWKSTYDMLERLFELKETVNSLSSACKVLLMGNEDWDFVSEFLKTFECVATAAVKLRSDALFYSDIHVILMDIILQVENLPCSVMQAALLEAVYKRKSKLSENDLFNTAVFLDPRIKVMLNPDQIVTAKSCIRQLHTRITSLKGNTSDSGLKPLRQNTDGPSTSSQKCNNLPKTLDEFLHSLDPTPPIKEEAMSSSLMSNIENDLQVYERQPRLALNENVMEFWSSQNNSLASVAEVVLAIPCTQFSDEQALSAMKYTLSDQGDKLSPRNLEHISLVRANGVFTYED